MNIFGGRYILNSKTIPTLPIYSMKFHSLVTLVKLHKDVSQGTLGLECDCTHCLHLNHTVLPDSLLVYSFYLKPPTDKLLTVLSYGESKSSQFLHEIVICSQ